MGNTLIKDATTGALMELSPGFVPIGMKEYGGILYIASADKDGNGEIGSIPSPVITWSQDDVTFIQINDMPLVTTGGISDTLVRISDKLKPGNRFVVLLNLESDGLPLEYSIKLPGLDTTLPLISTIDRKGLYRMELYSIGDTSTHRLTTVENTRQDWYSYNEDTTTAGKHWYIPYTGENFNLNLPAMLNHEGILQHYPKTGPGYLAIKAAIEDIESFKMIPRDEAGNQCVPINTFDAKTKYYISQFVGFQVKSKSGRRVGHIQITVFNESTHQYQPIFFWKPKYTPDAWGEYDESTFLSTGHQTMDLYLVEKSGVMGNALTTTAKWDEDEEYTIDYYYAANYKTPGVGCEYVGTDKLMNIYCNYPKYNNILYYSEENKNTAIPCLCYIKNTKQNIWYTVQAKYYDQFDQYIGTYNSIFNPYVNDVLGSMYGLETRDGEWVKQVTSSTTDVTLLEKNITIDFIDGNLKTGSLVPNSSYWTAGYSNHYAGYPATPKFKAATILNSDGDPDTKYDNTDLQCTLEKSATYTGALKSVSSASYLGTVVNYNKKTTNIPSPITSWELACALPYYSEKSTYEVHYKGSVSITTDRELLTKYQRVDGYVGYMENGKDLYKSPELRYTQVKDLDQQTLENLQYLGNDYFTYYYHNQWEVPVKQSIKGGVVMSSRNKGSVFVYGQPKDIFADIPVDHMSPASYYYANTNVIIDGNSTKLDVGGFDYNMCVNKDWGNNNAPKSFLVYALGTKQTASGVEPEYYSPKIHITIPETVITDVDVTYNQYQLLRQIEYDATTYDETGMKVTTLGGMNFKLIEKNLHPQGDYIDQLRKNAGTYIQPTNLVLGVEDNLPHNLIPSDGEGLYIAEDTSRYIYGIEQPNSTLKNILKYKQLANTDSVLDFSTSGTGFYVLLAYYSSNTPLIVQIGSNTSEITISNGSPYIWKSEDSTENLLKIVSGPEYYANIGLFAVKKSVQSKEDVVLPFVENYWENVMQGTCHYYMGKEEDTPTTYNILRYAFPEQPYQLNRYIVWATVVPAVYTWDTNNDTVKRRKATQIANCVTLQAGKVIQKQVEVASNTYEDRFDWKVEDIVNTGRLNKLP